MPRRIVYPRADGKWTWRLEADNDGLLAMDGGPGFENESDARSIADRIIEGGFRDADRAIVRRPRPFDQRLAQNIANGLRLQAGAQRVTASECVHVPLQHVPPGLTEAERRFWDEWCGERSSEPLPSADRLGPWTVPINFSGQVPVDGWAQLTIRRNGTWTFRGELRNSGLPSYDEAVIFMIKNLGTDEMYQFAREGRIHGTMEAGAHGNRWNESGKSPELADDWEALFMDGYHWHCRAGLNVELELLADAAQKAIGVTASVVAIV